METLRTLFIYLFCRGRKTKNGTQNVKLNKNLKMLSKLPIRNPLNSGSITRPLNLLLLYKIKSKYFDILLFPINILYLCHRDIFHFTAV